ncbi:MAG: rRNA maturation RNase YbeY [Woeseia sp.]
MTVQIACDADGLPDAEFLCRWPLAVFDFLELQYERRQELTVRIVSEAEGRALNRDYRGRDAATNVLSFPAGESPALPGDDAVPFGDLVLCGPVVLREAALQGKAASDHWAHLLVHGTLHLLGHDHEADAAAERMETLEAAILASHGLADPYIERESGG